MKKPVAFITPALFVMPLMICLHTELAEVEIITADRPNLSFTNLKHIGTKQPLQPLCFTWPTNDFLFSQQNVPIKIKAKGKQIPYWQLHQYGLCDTLLESPVNVATTNENIRLKPMGTA